MGARLSTSHKAMANLPKLSAPQVAMDLEDLLDEIKAERPATPLRAAATRSETFSYGDALRTARWKPEDKLPSHVLELSEYERSWLVTRIAVHLRSYEHYEWSEMKDVLQTVLKRLEALAHDNTRDRVAIS